MSGDSYRNDLEAASARIAALEREVRELEAKAAEQRPGSRKEKAPSTPDEPAAEAPSMEKMLEYTLSRFSPDSSFYDEAFHKLEAIRAWKPRYRAIMGTEPPQDLSGRYVPGWGRFPSSDSAVNRSFESTGDDLFFGSESSPLSDELYWLTVRGAGWLRRRTSNEFIAGYARGIIIVLAWLLFLGPILVTISLCPFSTVMAPCLVLGYPVAKKLSVRIGVTATLTVWTLATLAIVVAFWWHFKVP